MFSSGSNFLGIKPYEELKTTTMTLVIGFDGVINPVLAFHLPPVTRVTLEPSRKTSKCKLPLCTPGSIISIRYKGNIRGIIRNDSHPFKNAISMDLSTIKKNVGLKLSPSKIHMCGASSKENALEAVEHIFNHLKTVQKHLDKLANKSVKDEIIKWVTDATKGDCCQKEEIEHIPGNIILIIHHIIPDNLIETPESIPENFDVDLVSYLLSLGNDFIYHSDFIKKLNFVCTATSVFTGSLKIGPLEIAMENYNYSLGFNINRASLNRLIDGQNGFISRYDNALSVNVTVELPYKADISKTTSIKRRKNKIPHHTFLIYRSGSVTQSGPGGDLMKGAYYLFMNTIMSLKNQIEYYPK